MYALEKRLAVDVGAVDLVDDDDPVEAALLRVLHETPGHHLDPVLRVDHDRRGLDRCQRGQGVAGKVRIARGVQQMDTHDFVVGLGVEAGDRQLEGVSKLFFARRVVADCSTALDAPRRVNRSRFRQQRLGQCSLAAARLADERDRPDVLDGIRHGPASSLLRVIPESDNGQAVHTRIPHAS